MLVSTLADSTAGFKFISKSYVTRPDGTDVFTITFDFTMNGEVLRSMFVTLGNSANNDSIFGKVWYLSISAPLDELDSLSGAFDHMVSSFRPM